MQHKHSDPRIDTDPLIKIERTRDQLISWIKINELKQELDNELLSICIPSILKLFGSNADLLQYLIKYSSKPKLDAMYEIIHKTIQEYHVSDKTNLNSIFRNFAKISDESIINICSFLSRRDVIKFKRVSRRISIICLNEMSKCCIQTCLAKNLLNVTSKRAVKWNNRITVGRYYIATKYSSIFEHQQQANNFAEKYQVPIVIDRNGQYHNITRFDNIIGKSSLIIFDKRNLTILGTNVDNTITSRQMTVNDNFLYATQCVLVLYYFDVYNQQITLKKYLIINPNSITITQLKKYITNKLLCNSDTVTIHAMNGNKISLRMSEQCVMYFEKSSNIKIISLIFQTEPKLYDRSQRRFEYEVSTLKQFHFEYTGGRFVNMKTVTLLWLLPDLINLKKQIKYYIKNRKKNHKILQEIIKKIDTKFANKSKQFRYRFRVDDFLGVNILRHYFARFMFNDIIPAGCIEIYDGSSLKICDTRISSDIPHEISLRIVPYDTLDTTGHQHKILNISLYSEEQVPFPYNATKSKTRKLQVPIKILKDESHISGMMKQIIEVSKKPLFERKFKKMKQSLDNYINATNPNCFAMISDYKWVYDEIRDRDKHEWCRLLYESQSKCIKETNYKDQRITTVKLFMMPNINNNNKDLEHKLMVRFAWDNNFPSDRGIHKQLIGLPLFVWCNNDHTLQNILNDNQIIQKYKNCISKTYRVADDDPIVYKISKKKRHLFKIYDDLLLHCNSGFIIITIQNTKDITDIYGSQCTDRIILDDLDLEYTEQEYYP